MTYRLGVPGFRPLVSAFLRAQVQNPENLPLEGPFILAPNHMSNIDPFVMGYFMAQQGYHVRFMAKDSLFRIPVLGWILAQWGMIPVKRNSKEAANSLVYAQEALENGEIVGFYFEGTLTLDPAYWPMRGKTGLARLAMDTRVPIVPVVQWGAQDVLDRYLFGGFFRRRPKVTIRVLPELDYSDIEGDSKNHEGVFEITQRLQKTLEQASGDLRGQLPPKSPWDPKEYPVSKELTEKPFARWRKQLAKSAKRQDILPAKSN